ncbi:MAG: hypothetical protein JW982_05320 [Spirochaetes bacterium]|nr:hypothetical protein [Spirochaetota bacterium]
MKKIFFLTSVVLFLSTNAFAAAFMSPSLNGSTGLISTPTAKTGWEDAKFGVDIGLGWIDGNEDVNANGSAEDSTIGTFTVQLFNIWEIGGMYDMQDERGDDYMLNTKVRLDSGNSTVAIGGNYQVIDPNDDIEEDEFNSYQIYLVATYSGSFFKMPAETTILIGKTFWDRDGDADSDDVDDDENIDFSMGFDLEMFPSVFKGYVHWINDFANYSYSNDPTGMGLWRGIFNTGMRIAVLRDKRYKLNIDAIVVDALDANREFALKAAFGLSF